MAPATTLAQSRYSTSEAQEQLEQGASSERAAEESGDLDHYEDAVEHYQEAIKKDPTLAAAHVRLGYVLYVLKRSAEAVASLQGALERSPENIDLRHVMGINLYQLGREDEAAAHLEAVVRARDDLSDALFILGKYTLERERLDDALAYFNRYLELAPNDPQAHRALATITMTQGDLDGAHKALQRLIELDPDINAYVNLGHVSYADLRFDEAVAAYDEALRLDDGRLDVVYDRASVLFVAGRYDAAEAAFAELLRRRPQHLGAAYFLAEARLRAGDLAGAQEGFLAVAEMKPDYVYVYLKLADIALRLDHASDAHAQMKAAEKLGLDHPDSQALGGVVLRKLGRVDDAIALHQALVDAAPESANNRLLLASDLLLVRRNEDALGHLEKAVEFEPTNRAAWKTMSLALLYRAAELADAGSSAEAERLLRKVIELDIHPVEARINLALVALRTNDWEATRRFVEDARAIDPEHPSVLRLDARLLIRSKKYAEAEARLLPLTKGDGALMTGASWHDLAVAQAGQEKWAQAYESTKKAREFGVVEPRNASVIALRLAESKARAEQWRTADELFDEAAEHVDALTRSERLQLLYGSAVAALGAERFPSAARRLERLRDELDGLSSKNRKAALGTNTIDIDLALAFALYRSGKFESALAALDGYKKKQGDVAALEHVLRQELGRTAFEAGKLDDAGKHFERALKLGENTATALNLAAVRYRQGGSGAAVKTFQKYAARGIPEAIYNLAIYMDDVKRDPEQSVKYFREYLDKGGSRRDEVQTILDAKRRVFGIGGGGEL